MKFVYKINVFTDVPDSAKFDVTLMVLLIRNLTSLQPPANGYDQLPSKNDVTSTDDLARIKYYRNKIAHLKDGKIKSAFFIDAWDDICGVRL